MNSFAVRSTNDGNVAENMLLWSVLSVRTGRWRCTSCMSG